MSIKGMIFDLDGTLIDSMCQWESIFLDFLISHNIGMERVPKNLPSIIKTMDLFEASEYFVDIFNIPLSPNEIMAEIVSMISYKYRNEVPLKQGVYEFLENNKHFKKCVATASNKKLAAAILKRLKIDRHFQFVLTCTEVGAGKESPDIFLRCADMLELNPSEIIVFEDALHAMISAKKAGFVVAAVEDESSKYDYDEILKTADFYIEELDKFNHNF